MSRRMGKITKVFNGISFALTEYCLNSSLAGVAYIANKRYHITERLFWLTCIAVSSYGSYYLIKDYQDSFEQNAISIVVESVNPADAVQFPSIGVCEMGYNKEEYPVLEKIVENNLRGVTYNYDAEEFLLRIVYQNTYSFGSLKPYCSNEENCPKNGYDEIANKVRANCTEFFERCSWKGIAFNCCYYFLPLQTTMGKCFLLNSIQIISKDGPYWYDMDITSEDGNAKLEIELNKPFAIHILNEEEIPHNILNFLQFTELQAGSESVVSLSIRNVINDPGVRDIHIEHRKCFFPDEKPSDLRYKYYSFSTCVTACLKSAQLKMCNCTNYNMIIDDDDKSPTCDFRGFLCLDNNDLLYPQTTIMQPWRTNGLVCRCQPSCNDHEIQVVEKSHRVDSKKETRSMHMSLQSLPSDLYRRQAVRTKLDIVVSIGGILGLFMGASILSAIELLHFFTIRIVGTVYIKFIKDNEEKLQQK